MKLFFKCTAAAGLAMLLCLSSCEHKDLCYDHGHYVEVDVRFNWAEAPDANPSTMVVNFFSTDGKHLTTREFPSREGGKVKLESGEYKILFHNGDMERVKELTDIFDNYRLTTVNESLLGPLSRELAAPPRPSSSADEPVRTPAETVWAGRHDYVFFEPKKDGQFVELYPAEVTARYTVEVVNVENLRDNLGISAALTGLSEHLNISKATGGGNPVTVPFTIDRKDDSTIEARFVAFGHCPDDNKVSHILSIYTSSKTYYNFDVTDQVHTSPDDKNIYIRIDGLKLPAEGQNVSPSIDEWSDVVNVDIEMD